MDNLYHEILLEISRHPLNKKIPAVVTQRYQATNPLCGDEVELFFNVNSNGDIIDLGWQGEGCAISQAATSLFTEELKGKSATKITAINADTILHLLGLPNLNPTRLRCATLCLNAVKKSSL